MHSRPHAQSKRSPASRQNHGFSLVELMVVVLIVVVLSMVALPSYQQYMLKSRRSDAITALSAVVQAQERWRSNNPTYASAFASLDLPNTSPNRHYTLSLNGIGATGSFNSGYEVHATPVSTGRQAGDSACADMFIQVAGGQLLYLDTNSASTRGAPACWPQ